MSNDQAAQDPLDFVRGMWNNMGFTLPGMVTPTLDVDELDKRIADMRAVEGWLKMNLNMLQITIQGLDMQRATIAAVKAMSQQMREGGDKTVAEGDGNPFAAAAMWPWNMMTQPPAEAASEPPPAQPKPASRRKTAEK
ncbi:hypothetical protein J5J83_17480 [Azoarcus sp. L1K30]|uniref:PhaM family polyhydroxyalkanoate granule multifunctional regulatory protein n=1 Tax=Azoarcus sp. L1K30 TaxID=2820277 RepID=UPI001B82E780|nr:PhaM family polyhydroxyalkanoate granule multifunctional regulatory protein [Azoarcus sp. L1K30]MBR0567917.1 hypothetical protein [Azoarcus sp. L1K30]